MSEKTYLKDETWTTSSLASSNTSELRDATYKTHRNGPKQYREVYFFKGNGFSSKAKLRSSDDVQYQLIADIHKGKESSMQLQQGTASHTRSLGSLTFPSTHNDFRIFPPAEASKLIQVKARIGHPNPSSYTFTLPATSASRPRQVVWKVSGNRSSGSGYALYVESTNELIASWALVSGQKHQAMLRFHVEPADAQEEALIMLSFIGTLTRLSMKGKDPLADGGSGLARYNGFWFMAILGTAAVA